MADRTVKVTLKANVTDFKAQMKQATTSLEEAVQKADKTGQVADTALGRMTQRATLMGPQMGAAGAAMTGMGAALLGVGGMAIKTAADFDQAMSSVQAATHAPTGEMEKLRAAAMKAGADTAFSATEAAQGIEELTKAGVSTADVLGGGLDGALALAAAGGVSVADAAETAATALTQFKLQGADVTHVADLLAAGAGKAQGGVGDLSQALSQGGLVASQMGLSIEETVGGLSAFASAGLIGSDAGTSFKTMLQRLSNPSKEAAGLMKDLGINVYDSQGKFVGLASVAGQLHDKMGSLSDAERNAAMSTIFGADAVRAASVLYDQGAEGIQGWIDAVNDSGYAAETASLMQDNLKGKIEQLGGSMETALIKMGEGGQGPLMWLVDAATNVVNAFSDMPPAVQQSVTVLSLLGGAGLTAAGGFMMIVPKIAETKAAMDSLGISATSAFKSTSKLARIGRMAGMAGFIASMAMAQGGTDQFKMSTEAATNALKQMDIAGKGAAGAFKSVDIAKYSAAELGDALHDINGGANLAEKGLEAFGNAMDFAAGIVGADTRSDFQKIKDDLASMGEALAGMDSSQAVNAFKQLAEMTDGSQDALNDLLGSMPAYKEHLATLATEAGLAADDQTLLAIAMGEVDPAATGAGAAAAHASRDVSDMGDAAQDAQEKIDELTDSLSKLQGLVLSEREAQRGFQEAIKAASDAVAEHGQTLDITTEAGRENAEALDDLAKSAMDVVDSMGKNGASIDDMRAKMAEGREAVIQAAQAFGMSREEAEAYADEMLLIPDMVTTEVKAKTEQATSDVDAFIKATNDTTGSVQVGAKTYAAETDLATLMADVAASKEAVTIDGQTMPASDALTKLLGIVNNSDGTISILGDPTQGRYQADQLVVYTDQQTGKITIGARDQATGEVRRIVSGFPISHTITIYARKEHSFEGGSQRATMGATGGATEDLRVATGRKAFRYAGGGAVVGPGTATSDDVLAWLGNGEHVLTGAEVKKMGGQAAVYRMRALIRAGMLHFASGGSPSTAPTALPPVVKVAAPAAAAPEVNMTILLDNPLTGEQIRQVVRTEADGRIVRASRMTR